MWMTCYPAEERNFSEWNYRAINFRMRQLKSGFNNSAEFWGDLSVNDTLVSFHVKKIKRIIYFILSSTVARTKHLVLLTSISSLWNRSTHRPTVFLLACFSPICCFRFFAWEEGRLGAMNSRVCSVICLKQPSKVKFDPAMRMLFC